VKSVHFTLFALLTASSDAFANSAINLTRGVSPISRDVYHLHMTILWICVAIGLIVFGVMFYAILFHRKSRGAQAAHFHSHPWLEITWTIVPFLILVAMAVPATKVLLHMNNDDEAVITIRITGYQWKWQYEYLEDGISFFSNLSTPMDQRRNLAPKGPHYLQEVDHPLVVPVHQKIRFLMTSNDVNHSWWVPDLAVKRDALPGFINEAWTVIDKPGTYYGQCAELCGINHAFMPIVVIAMSTDGYKQWVARQKSGAPEEVPVPATTTTAPVTQTPPTAQPTVDDIKAAIARGAKIYDSNCSVCHQPDGTGMPPTFPSLKDSKMTTGPVADHIDRVLNGKAGTAMMAFKNQLNDQEIADVVTYERNSWGHNSGWVKVDDVKSAHK
jgi:cytochrome c oxidase subunit 2